MTESVKPEPTENPVFRERLRQETLDKTILHTKYALWIASFVYPLFWFLDLLASPENKKLFLLFRLGVLATYLIGLVLLNRPLGRRLAYVISVGVVFSSAFGIVIMIPLMGGFASDYYIGVLMALFVAGLFMPWPMKPTIVCCLLIVGGYLAVNLAVAMDTATLVSVSRPVFFLGGTSIFTIFANWGKERTRKKDVMQRMQIEKNNEDLKALDEAKMRFFSNVSHELRTPLMLILGPLEALRQGREPASTPEMLAAMDTNARRLLRQVNTILDFAKMDSGNLQCHYTSTNLGAILKELTDAARPHAARKGITLSLENADRVPECPMDPEKVETIAANLLSNALKFTPQGGRIVLRIDYDADKIWFEVADTGTGIPEDKLDDIFERFLQVDNTLSRQSEGTGLGLAMVKELTKLHRGRISVKSRLGEGSTFHVELPRNPEFKPLERRRNPGRRIEDKMAAERTAALVGAQLEKRSDARTLLSDVEGAKLESRAEAVTAAKNQAPADAPRLLYLEDNLDLQTFVANSLSNRYRIETANDGVEAFEKLRRFTPDLILSDVMMPRMDGYEFCRRLRADGAYDKVPVVMVTAKSGAEAVVEGLDIGANDYISKPFEMRELEARLAAHLRVHRLEKNLQERDSRLSAIGKMTSSIVHDLKNPLTSILGFAELLKADVEAGAVDSVGEMIDPIVLEARRLQQMITEVLDFARGKAVDLQTMPTAVKPYLERICAPIRDRQSAMGIELILDLGKDESVELNWDPNRMQRVFENLLKNAQEALVESAADGPPKHIWISVKPERQTVEVRVSDDGPGIPAELTETLFDLFATSGKKSGTGLGLATVRNIVVAHGGDIQALPKGSHGGAEFIMKFPLQIGAAEAPDSHSV